MIPRLIKIVTYALKVYTKPVDLHTILLPRYLSRLRKLWRFISNETSCQYSVECNTASLLSFLSRKTSSTAKAVSESTVHFANGSKWYWEFDRVVCCLLSHFNAQLQMFVRPYIQCESKSSPPKLSALFSLMVNLCNWTLYQLLSSHILMSTPILVHMSEYLCELYHFYRAACNADAV